MAAARPRPLGGLLGRDHATERLGEVPLHEHIADPGATPSTRKIEDVERQRRMDSTSLVMLRWSDGIDLVTAVTQLDGRSNDLFERELDRSEPAP